MSRPLVSVVIPVFNGLPYLQQAYASVITQDYSNIEIVVVDGGSSDESVPWLEQLTDPRVRLASLPPGTPPAVTWTEATTLAHGEFIKLLCQDDVLYPGAISQQVADLARHPEACAAVAQRDVISASGKVLVKGRGTQGLPSGNVSGQAALRAAYLAGTNIFGEPHTLLFRSEALLAAMPWRGERPYLLDLDTYTVVFDRPDAEIIVRKSAIGAFRVSASSWSTRLAAIQKAQLREWQSEFVDRHPTTAVERVRAFLSVNVQNLARRLTYAWLGARRDLV